MPVGYPVEDTEILLLNKAGEKTDIYGEIAIRSPYIALGYWQKPELTKLVFMPDPKDASRRIYRTGDMGRLKPDGSIEFLGRQDFQVKIRGFRIELGEIESVLNQYYSIGETVVIAREDIPGNKHLVAYIIPQSTQIIIIDELRRFLKNKLPDYMVPTKFIILSSLPLTPSGKINRLALPIPDVNSSELSTNFVAPSDELERKLIEIWQQILGIELISIHDNFFALGGHSLLAVKLFWQIEQIFGKQLPLATLFQSGTVQELAEIIRETTPEIEQHIQSKSSWSSLVEIQPKGSKPPLFCIHPLGGEIFCYRNLSLHLGLDQPVYGLQPQGLDGKQPLHTRVEEMAAHYIREMQTLQPHGSYFLGGYSFGGIVALEIAQQLQQQGEKVSILVIFDTCLPGYSQPAPFLELITDHLFHFYRRGVNYLSRRVQKWSSGRQNHTQIQSKSFVDMKEYLPEADKHLEIISTNSHAASKYIFSAYSGNMTLFRAEDKNRGEIGIRYDPQFGWGNLVTGRLDIYYVPGSHISLLDEPNVQVLAKKLRDCLRSI